MNLKESFIKIFYPQDIKCIVCGKELFEDNTNGICSGCSLKTNVRFCLRCGRAIGATSDYCDDCKNNKRYFTVARAPFIFTGKAKKLVHRLKYGGEKYLSRYMARFLADEYHKNKWDVDIVTFVPMHIKRQKDRGYNQAELIANELGKILDKPVIQTLTRIKYSNNFARLTRKERIKEAEESFFANDKYKDKIILLVDDVFTTGATTGACSKELLKSGASQIFVLTFCTAECKTELY